MKSPKYKILVVTSTFTTSGAGLVPDFISGLCSRLKSYNMDVHVLAPHAYGLSRFEVLDGVTVYRHRYFIERFQSLAYGSGIMENLRANPLNFFLLPCFIIAQLFSLSTLLLRNDYHAIHAHWLIPQGALSIWARLITGRKDDIPIICTSHGSDLFKLNNFFLNKLKKWVIESCEQTVVVSQHMKEHCATLGIATGNISVIPMGIDLRGKFKPVTGVKRARRRIVYVGRLIESKGILQLLDAMNKIKDSVDDLELHIVGDGSLRKILLERVEQGGLSNNIVIHGAVVSSKLPALYSSASIFVFPSVQNEGLGLVVVEALACGCVVVASQLESLKGIVVDGVNGLSVLPGDVNSLADALLKLLSDDALYQSLSTTENDAIINKYDWATTGRSYYELIEANIQQTAKLAG